MRKLFKEESYEAFILSNLFVYRLHQRRLP